MPSLSSLGVVPIPVPTKNLVRVDFVDFCGIGPVALLV
jgi:hypothetical protein